MSHSKDAEGILSEDYNTVLKLDPGASPAEYRAAYIALAKRWHPDKNNDPGAAAQFRRLAVAYSESLQASAGAEPTRKTHGGASARIVRCSQCSEKLLLPQRAEFMGVMSFLLWSWRRRVSGVFCQHCARSAAIKASATSLFLGWWSVQGIVVTPLIILTNLRGGRQDKAVNFKLSCHNLFALTAAGDLAAARTLARLIIAQRQSLPATVAHLVSSLTAETKNER